MTDEALQEKLIEYTSRFDEICGDRFTSMFQREFVSLSKVEDVDSTIEGLADLYNQIYFIAVKAMYLKDLMESKLVKLADEHGFIPTSEVWSK